MNILISGGGGFIGKRLVEELSTKHKFSLLTSKQKTSENMFVYNLVTSKNVEELCQELADKNIDIIIHLVARMCSSENQTDLKLLEENAAITKNMLLIAQELKPKMFINDSSIAVYPNQDGCYREDSIIDMSSNSDCIYGVAKFNSEILFNFFLGKLMDVVNLRISQVYGPGMRGDRIIPSIIDEIKTTNTATVFGEGERVINFIHIADLVKSIQGVIQKPCSGTYNVGCVRNEELGKIVLDLVSIYGNEKTEIKKIKKGSRVRQEINSDAFLQTFEIRNEMFDFSSLV